MKLSVIIPCLNAAETIATQLEALSRQRLDSPWEVIVADNGSTDGTHQVVQHYASRLPGLRIIDAFGRRGAGHARNVGAAAATGAALLFCDADDEVGPQWLAAMGEALREHSFVTGPVDFGKLNKHALSPRAMGVRPYHNLSYLPRAITANLGIRRSVHERVGGFDETLLCAEDVDYSWRIQLAGIALHFVPQAVVYYRYRSSMAALYRQHREWGEYDVILYKRYRPLGMPKQHWYSGVRHWVHLLRWLPRLYQAEKRARWLRLVAYRVGRLRGSIKHRVLAI